MYEKNIEPVAIMHTGFGEKFGIPRQSGLVPKAMGQIILEPKYRNPDALRGIEEFSHLWIIWGFSKNKVEKFTPLVSPPRLGGKEKRGVFATRSPFRPNGMGLSSVKLEKVDWNTSKGPVVYVSGVDMLDGTPVYDIKPYLAYADSHEDAVDGFAGEHRWDKVSVSWQDDQVRSQLTEEQAVAVEHILAQDPRAAYNKEKDYIYGMRYEDFDVRFIADADEKRIEIVDIVPHGADYRNIK
ncbi:tRNA (N6-threonylcarbamoyladenosine(37)-N6)-methyltransferase TrmO [Agathobacter sp.]